MSTAPQLNPQAGHSSAPATDATRPTKRRDNANSANGSAPWWTVAKREMSVKLRDKAFIIGTLSSLGLIILAMVLGAVLAPKFNDSQVAVAVADDQAAAMVEAVGEHAQATAAGLEVQVVRADSVAAAKTLVKDGDAAVFLEPKNDAGWQVWTLDKPAEAFTELLAQTVQAQVVADLAQRGGVNMDEVNAQLSVTTDMLEEPSQSELVSALVRVAFALIFLMTAMLYGLQIATSVIEEKQSRIVEILVSAIPVRHLLLGKILGISLIAFGQVLVLLIAALIGLNFTPLSEMLPEIVRASAWFMLFFVAGFVALATLWAAAGALGTRAEDLNQTTGPLTWILMIAYLFGFMATGTVRIVASYVPIISAILMPTRIAEGDVAWWELLVALALNVAFAAITIHFGSKIYRRALLQTGGKLSFRQAAKLAD